MRSCRTPCWRRSLVLAALVYGLGAAGDGADAQSLGEIARCERARRAAITPPSPFYGNVERPDRDIPPTPVPPAPGVALLPVLTLHGCEGIAFFAPSLRPSGVPARLPAADVPVERPVAALGAGWSAFQIQKTPEEMAETARLAGGLPSPARTRPTDVRLPPQHDVLRLATGVGYIQGADVGLDVAATGKVNGMQTDISGFFTAGPLGLRPESGRVSILSPGGRWRGEGGDLYSDLRGLARGGRLSWIGSTWTPSVSVYVPRAASVSTRGTAIAYRDRYQLLPRVQVGGELTSDGAAFLQGRYADPRFNVTAFTRYTRGAFAGHDKGVSGGVTVARGVVFSGALRLSDAQDDSRRWQMASARLPLGGRTSVTLERSWWTGSPDDGTTNALTLQVPIGPVRLLQRVQWGRTDYRQRALPFGFDRRQTQSMASYSPGAWGSLRYQQSTQWFDDGRVQLWDEIGSMVQVGRSSVQFVSAFPDLWEPRRLRVRVRQQLSPTLLLEAQYGRLSAFQQASASAGETSRAMVTMRKTWQVRSPARGGDVEGRALDQAGHPVPGALVRLGPYSAITDDDGRYRFTRLPDGEFQLALDRNALPAAYAWDEAPRAVHVTRGRHASADLQVIPLNAIRGRVYIDRNGNGRYDDGEGVPHVVVAVNGAVTATSADGSYAFYNQPPGRHLVSVDVSRLASDLAPHSDAERHVELTGDRPSLGIDFILERKDRPIIMREIGP